MTSALAISVIAAIVIATFALSALIIQWAWNTFAVAALHLGAIDYIQAIALTVLLTAISGGARAVTR